MRGGESEGALPLTAKWNPTLRNSTQLNSIQFYSISVGGGGPLDGVLT